MPRYVYEYMQLIYLYEGDVICITHSGKNYYLDIREVKPNGAASIIETDCDVDFEVRKHI
jgi:hypothetical protein